MLTVKLYPYNKNEVDTATHYVSQMWENFLAEKCPAYVNSLYKCEMCEYRHMCADFDNLLRYLHKEQESEYPHVYKHKKGSE